MRSESFLYNKRFYLNNRNFLQKIVFQQNLKLNYNIFRCKFENIYVNINNKNEINVIYAYFNSAFNFQNFKKKLF